MAFARFTVYVAPTAGRPGRPLRRDDDPTRSVVGWRLLAANNRDVARSAYPYPDVDSCVEAVCSLRRGLREATIVATRADAVGRAEWPGIALPGRAHAIWTWLLRLGDSAVAVSSRGYQRRLQCEAAGALFVSLVPGAAWEDMTVLPGRSLSH